MAKKSEKVPKEMGETYTAIVGLTDAFAKQHLNGEYAQLIRYATAALCRKRPSPLVSGKPNTWACGIVHALGMVNFLFDKTQKPHIGSSELAQAFGVGQSTSQGKSKQVRDILRMSQFDPEWMLPSRISESPMAWMIMVNGLIVDARSLPKEIQQAAYEKGLIPYVPD